MKVELTGNVVEVGDVDNGTAISRGVLLEVKNEDAPVFVPLTIEQCREVAPLMFRDLTISVTIEAREGGK